jgi:RNA polymerase sigma-70 factor, ECF subfamily
MLDTPAAIRFVAPPSRHPSRAAVHPAIAPPVERPTVEALFDTYHDAIYAHILRLMGGDAEEARDLTQETFLRVHRALHRFTPYQTRAWIYRIARNLCLDALRRRRLIRWQSLGQSATNLPEEPVPHRPGALLLATPVEADPAVCALRTEERDQVRAVLALLSPGYRRVLILREYECLSYAEIARTLARTRPAVKSLLFRARAQFREHWQTRQRAAAHGVEAQA